MYVEKNDSKYRDVAPLTSKVNQQNEQTNQSDPEANTAHL